MNLQSIALARLSASGQPRPLLTAQVDMLAASIKELGLIQPITVKKSVDVVGIAEHGWQIVAGHHRVAACRALGWTEIDALVIEETSHLQSELMEIDENLCRAELTASQRTSYTKRRKQIWEALHPVETQVAHVAPPENKPIGNKSPPPQTQGFAAATAAATGQSKATTNRAIARAEALGDEALTKVAHTSLDKGVELDALAKMDEPERSVLIERAVSGEQVSARQTVAQANKSTVLADLSASIRKALRGVLDGAGCLSIKEMALIVNREMKTATEDDIALISESVDYLEEWAAVLCSLNIVDFAKRV